jgi:hypothetical protein
MNVLDSKLTQSTNTNIFYFNALKNRPKLVFFGMKLIPSGNPVADGLRTSEFAFARDLFKC